MWEDITVYQFQKIFEILNSQPPDATDIDIDSDIIAFMEDINVNELTIREFKEYQKQYSFLLEPIPSTNPVSTFKARGKKYGVVYDVSEVNLGMYNEVIKFSENKTLITNLHKVLASIVRPMKRNWAGLWVVSKEKVSHNKLADAMLHAPFIVCYNAAVFFYQVFRGYLETMKESYLLRLMEIRKMSRKEAEETYQILMNNMDGYTMQSS